jgi:hypothetical protein
VPGEDGFGKVREGGMNVVGADKFARGHESRL